MTEVSEPLWKHCKRCNWPHGKYQHSRFCIPEQIRRAEADKPYHSALEELDLAVSTVARRPETTARLVKELGWEGRWDD